jgi:ribosomal protein S18 acetylase RimI-like enzyme
MNSHTPGLHFRSATDADVPDLLALRHRTMDPHFQSAGLIYSEQDHLARIGLRFDCAQLICRDEQLIGLLKLVKEGEVWELIQLQLAPEVQGAGFGTQLLQGILQEAQLARAAVQLSVFKTNPAQYLYQRLGFIIHSESEHSYEMLWRPE